MFERRDSDGGGTVGKALGLLDLVASFARPVRFGELLAASGLPKATLHRLLRTLSEEGMLTHDPDGQTYAPGLRLVRLAHAAWAQTPLAAVARQHLDRLAAETGQTVHLALLDGGHVLYLDKRRASRAVSMFSDAGMVGPAYCTGLGKAMLAFLPEPALQAALAQQTFHRFTPRTLGDAEALREDLARIRARGHALDAEEHEPGIICVGVPILGRSGRLLGAVSITGATGQIDLAGLEALAPRVKSIAAAIGRDAESWSFPEPVQAGRAP